MSLDENKQTIRRFIQTVWEERKIEALPDFWTEDCINYAMPGSENQGLMALFRYHGQFFDAFKAFSDVRIEITQQVAEDDRVVTQMTTHARHTGDFMGAPATGKSVFLQTMRIDRLDKGRIAEHWSVADMAGLMQQLSA